MSGSIHTHPHFEEKLFSITMDNGSRFFEEAADLIGFEVAGASSES